MDKMWCYTNYSLSKRALSRAQWVFHNIKALSNIKKIISIFFTPHYIMINSIDLILRNFSTYLGISWWAYAVYLWHVRLAKWRTCLTRVTWCVTHLRVIDVLVWCTQAANEFGQWQTIIVCQFAAVCVSESECVCVCVCVCVRVCVCVWVCVQ